MCFFQGQGCRATERCTQGTVVPVLGSPGIPSGKDPDEAIHEALQGGSQDELLTKCGSHFSPTGVGIDVPIVGDWFHITKPYICWKLPGKSMSNWGDQEGVSIDRIG